MSDEEQTYRAELATEMAELMQEKVRSLWPANELELLIHWDDCDMDHRRFWFHFRVPGLIKIMGWRKPWQVKAVQDLIRQMKALTKTVGESKSDYELHWHQHSRPLKRYVQIDRQKYPDGYDCDTWIYVLSFYG